MACKNCSNARQLHAVIFDSRGSNADRFPRDASSNQQMRGPVTPSATMLLPPSDTTGLVQQVSFCVLARASKAGEQMVVTAE